ncbi:hypothetical protein [Segetibacter aerophilus]|uniref:hypothetical protein n=1 Tax=Segetibacter aerophilus TaxID=670293 RepID=UPI0014791FA4|nr:hypothetical protein [Segetibacter aerophilus]
MARWKTMNLYLAHLIEVSVVRLSPCIAGREGMGAFEVLGMQLNCHRDGFEVY